MIFKACLPIQISKEKAVKRSFIDISILYMIYYSNLHIDIQRDYLKVTIYLHHQGNLAHYLDKNFIHYD